MTNQEVVSYSDNFSKTSFWSKLKNITSKLGKEAVYNILLLYYLMTGANVPFNVKLEIAGALGYLILPTDLIPDCIPVAGYSDDLAAVMFVLNLHYS
jgi:uncharacterized membrane protein YkvA (DUF1232 family)